MGPVTRLLAIDHALRAWVVAHRLGALDGVMWLLSALGRGGLIWVLLAGALLIAGRLQRSAVVPLLLALVFGSVAADHVLKPLVHRTRPFVSSPDVRVIGGRPGDSSFPSGHATNAFAGASVLAAVSAEPAVLWWALAAAIAYSRVYLGVHYPLDVTAGALLGVAAGLLALTAFRLGRRHMGTRSPGKLVRRL